MLAQRGTALGVAGRRTRPVNSATAAVGNVNMVVTDGGGTYETHSAAVEQRGVAVSACAHKERIGIFYVGSRNIVARLCNNIAPHSCKRSSKIGNLFVHYNLHGVQYFI